jgi:hypothetical protein
MNINDISTEQLKQELDRRLAPRVSRPKQKLEVDFERFRNLLESYVNKWSTLGLQDDDEHFIFEEVVEAFYGKDFWQWYNGLR